MRAHHLLLLCISVCICLAGCAKPSVEGETKAYNANVGKSKKYQELYPAFASTLKADADKAAALFKEGEGMAGEEAIAKMKDANKSFGSTLMTLQKIESMEEKVRDQMSSLDELGEKLNVKMFMWIFGTSLTVVGGIGAILVGLMFKTQESIRSSLSCWATQSWPPRWPTGCSNEAST